MTVIRVALADDHTLFRRGLRLLLEGQADMRVVGEAADGEACLRLVEEQSPDVVLMDVSMPLLDGIQATQIIASRWPGVQVVGLTMHANERYFFSLLEAGAVGYLLKGANPEDLLAAIRMAAQGETYLSPPSPTFWWQTTSDGDDPGRSPRRRCRSGRNGCCASLPPARPAGRSPMS